LIPQLIELQIGLPSYILKDGYFYVYYGDSHDLAADGRIQNTTVGGAGNPDQGVAVVRAPVADVVAAAKVGGVTQWWKSVTVWSNFCSSAVLREQPPASKLRLTL
jgi:hypothetical protein